MTARREHPRRRRLLRRPPVAHPPDPSQNVAADLEDFEGRAPLPGRDWDPADVLDDVSRETVPAVLEDPPPPLSKERIARLEAATAQWVRDVRIGGPGPDDTLLWPPSSLPPVPAARRPQLEEAPVARPPVDPTDATDLEGMLRGLAAETEARRAAPARVSDWTSRHDPESLKFAAQAKLGHPVPLQDFQLELGPILDQGTTPPLNLHDASACTGMAAVAAANCLELASRSEYGPAPRHGGAGLLDVDDARALYLDAQRRDTRSGESYAGTSVLAVMKAGQAAGLWDTYLWAIRGTRDIAQVLLQLQAPVVVGIPWRAGLESPDARGIIRPTGPAAGGHALTVVGIRRAVAGGDAGPYFVLQQSRGPAEGLGGRVLLHHAHLAGLLAGIGEAAVPLPRWGTT